MTILNAFVEHPAEAAIIGRLIAGYGELEFDLAWCVRWIIKDEDTAFKVMFRAPGEVQRILMADAMARLKLPEGKDRTLFAQAISGMHHCRKIRNQYAHCHWLNDANGDLQMLQLEEIATQNESVRISAVTQHKIDLALLTEQESYFSHIESCLTYLVWEAQVRAGEIASNPSPKAPPSRPLARMRN